MVYYLLIVALVWAKYKVFVVFHSHNDAGWLMPAEDYYQDSTQHILNNLIDFLEIEPSFKFVWAETYFLSRYLEDYPHRKDQVKNFIKSGKLEIVGGGWVQNDEALADVEFVLRQMEIGFNYLRDELGVNKIKTGWQLDPFGHSSLTAALWEKMGFESLVFSRVERKFKQYLEVHGDYEFIWKGEGFGAKNGILTHVLNEHYYSPVIFDTFENNDRLCFEYIPPNDEDIDNCVQELEIYIASHHHRYKSNNHLMLIGGDFFFSNYDFTREMINLIKNLQNKSETLEIVFGTASEYFDAVFESKVELKEFHGDLLPYITKESKGLATWTGFYSLKPHLKQSIIEVEKLARASEIIQASLKQETYQAKKLALTSHHDAITGTSRDEVIDDYSRLLNEEKEEIFKILGKNFYQLLEGSESTDSISLPFKVLFLFNPLGWAVEKTMNFLSSSEFFNIFSTYGEIYSQSVPWEDKFKIFFKFRIEAFTLVSVFVSQCSSQNEGCSEASKEKSVNSINSNNLKITFRNGFLEKVRFKQEISLDSKILYYYTGENGPYTFVPSEPFILHDSLIEFKVYSGKLVQLAISKFSFDDDVIIQRVLIERKSSFFKMNFVLSCTRESEVLIRFHRIPTNSPWFFLFNTANIMEKTYRPDDYNRGHNYYPINGGLYVNLTTDMMYIIPNFPLLAGMPDENSFELGLNRHPIKDDNLGLVKISEADYVVEHDWLVGFHEISYPFIWKTYLEYRNSPLVLFDKNENQELTNNVDEAQEFIEKWSKKSNAQVFEGNNCSHLNSIGSKGSYYLASILNICNEPSNYPFRIINETYAGGFEFDLNKKIWRKNGIIHDPFRDNSLKNVFKYPKQEAYGKISSFDLVTYVTDLSEFTLDDIKIFNGTNPQLLILIFILAIILLVIGYFAFTLKSSKRMKMN